MGLTPAQEAMLLEMADSKMNILVCGDGFVPAQRLVTKRLANRVLTHRWGTQTIRITAAGLAEVDRIAGKRSVIAQADSK